jgi:hypothetical protein
MCKCGPVQVNGILCRAIVLCRSAWSTVHASQSGGTEVDDTALTTCAASCEELEELGYSVEERSAELEIMLMDDETPYGGGVLVKAAAFMNFGAVVMSRSSAPRAALQLHEPLSGGGFRETWGHCTHAHAWKCQAHARVAKSVAKRSID